MNTIIIYIYDDCDGACPVKCEIRRNGSEIEIFKKGAIRIRVPIDSLMALVSDEQHG